MSKIIKIEQISEAEARWEKYRSEKLSSRQEGDGQPVDPSSIVEDARAEAERIRREAFESGFAQAWLRPTRRYRPPYRFSRSWRAA